MSFILDTILTAAAILVAYHWGHRRGEACGVSFMFERYPQLVYWEKLRAGKAN